MKNCKNLNFESDDEEHAAKFSMINPNLFDLDLEDSDGVSSAPVTSTVINR